MSARGWPRAAIVSRRPFALLKSDRPGTGALGKMLPRRCQGLPACALAVLLPVLFDGRPLPAAETAAVRGGVAPVVQLDTILSGEGLKRRTGELLRGPARREGRPASLLPRANKFPKVIDPGDESPLDFSSGDTVSIEAWIRLDAAPGGVFPYIVGKGRTHTVAGKRNDANQNYALRLSGGGTTKLSFLWMEAADPQGRQRPHRWTSKAAVPVDGRWHHVAVIYTFGTGDDAVGFIDGKQTGGTWDMLGNSAAAPVTDNDDLWIGGSYGSGHRFPGLIDGLVIYRGSLPAAVIAERTAWVDSQRPGLPWPPEDLPVAEQTTRVAISDLPMRSWFAEPTHTEPTFTCDGFALTRLPNRYNDRGLISDRPGGSMVRLATTTALPKGTCRLLLRSLDAARVYLDDTLLVEQKTRPKPSGSAHGRLDELAAPPAGVVQQTAAHLDTVVEFESDGRPHRFEAYRLLGGEGRVPQLGEFLVAVAAQGEPFKVLGAEWQPDDTNWQRLLDRETMLVTDWNRAARNALDAAEDARWARRHDEAARAAGPPVELPAVYNERQIGNSIDRFIQARLEAEGLEPMPLLDDDAFLRRATLDATGRIPTLAELRQLGRDRADPPPLDREAVIDRLLASPEWADHWTPYWLDVLAENPALTKPTLNNTGPFRWYIHDALIDNWGMDRFVTNLILMEGSPHLGGPAGFGLASQNDVPMAAKAHILGTAFLGVEMKCARCHDAPNHPFRQEELFSLAAMLERKPLQVPASSSIPATPAELEEMLVTVSIKPGEKISPAWPFEQFASPTDSAADSRARLAEAITSPQNLRFREVLANRLWTRLIGVGLVSETSDWTDREASHPDLLRFLARELLVSGDDMKHLARLIMASRVYQRQVVPGLAPYADAASELRGPIRRRLTAEQLVDSLHTATGQPMRGEVQGFGQDGSQPRKTFLELGRPARAWQLVCTASERDRNSLRLPEVDMLNELLEAYGWRPQRQDPQDRPGTAPTPLQPLMLANGPAAARLLDATPGSLLTREAVAADTPEAFIHTVSLAVLGRRATDRELERFLPLIAADFTTRLTGEEDNPQPIYRRRISWRNHFDPRADTLVLDRIAALEAGDPPTQALQPDWREAAEDLQWVLINSPEFSWLP